MCRGNFVVVVVVITVFVDEVSEGADWLIADDVVVTNRQITLVKLKIFFEDN